MATTRRLRFGIGRILAHIVISAYWRTYVSQSHCPMEVDMPTLTTGVSEVTAVPAAAPEEALAHFQSLLTYETDCWDVHAALVAANPGFTLLDVRAPELFAAGHVPGAINLPHRRINERNRAGYPTDGLFVVYCSGPHCNGADRAAIQLARLGRSVKK